MNKYQLWSVDEYGQSSIITSSVYLDEMIKKGKSEVSIINVDNALTAIEKKRNWEAFFVEIDDENIIYGGKNSKGKHFAYLKNDDEFSEISLEDIKEVKKRMYLGYLDNENWYAEDERQNEINDMGHKDLMNKTVYFVKKI